MSGPLRGGVYWGMDSPVIRNIEKMLAAGKDSALLRFSLGNEYLKLDQPGLAAEHLERAVALDPAYSAAWKQLGKALTQAQRPQQALAAYRRGIEVAQGKGELQAAKEMAVFARRLERQAPSSS